MRMFARDFNRRGKRNIKAEKIETDEAEFGQRSQYYTPKRSTSKKSLDED